jgi:hypothetical protein
LALSIFKHGDRYQVAVSPPHGQAWRSSHPLTATEVLEKLASLGCHSTDITDALYAADPGWTAKHNEEVLRRRKEAAHQADDLS